MARIWFCFIFLFTVRGHAQVLNEICPSNADVFETEHEGFSDWVELYNNAASPVDLSAFYISNDRDELMKWNSPAIMVEPYEFLVLSAADLPTNDSTIPFSFGRKGGTVYLADASGMLLDSIKYPGLLPNHSYGRYEEDLFYFETPTPEAMNETETAYKGYATTPTINRLSGNHPPGTNIVIEAPVEGQTVYYSFNGTNPLDGLTYTSPIILDKTVSIRAVAVGDSLIRSAPVYRTYFVNVRHKLPVVNLNLDSLELLDEIIGIYVLGPDAEPDYPYYGANFWKDIEIHAFYEYFDLDMVMQESLDCGIKIHGGTVSSTRPMKSLRLVAHDRYEKDEFTYPYFDNKSIHKFKRLLLRNSGSDFNKTHLKDGVLHRFILDHDIDVDAQAYEPVIVYINGLYWGIHNLREKLDKYYPASNYPGVDPEKVNLLEEEELILIAGDSAEFTVLRDFIVENDMNDPANYNWVQERLDLSSMVDYFIMELYMNNRDWPYNNLKLWNSSSHPQWRYFYSDLDAGIRYYGKEQLDFHFLEKLLGPDGEDNVHVVIFKKMLSNEEFQRYFINRYADLMNTIFQADYILEYVYKAREKLDPEMRRHFYKWYGVMEEWHQNFNAYDVFFSDRVDIVRNELSVVFQKEQPVAFYVGMYPSGSGTVQLNTLALDSFPFIGQYYPDNLIDLTIKPIDGHSFLYWENLRTGTKHPEHSVQIDPVANDSLIAVFAEDQTAHNLEVYPNPILAEGTVTFSIPESGQVFLEVFGTNGVHLVQIDFNYLAKGSYSRRFNFSQLQPGTYLLMIRTESGREALPFVKL